MAWNTSINDSPNYVWEQKLKITKKALKEWSKKPTNIPKDQRIEEVQHLENLQSEMDTMEITKTELEKEQVAK